ncbi:hypothetical protein [Micromonospora sp. WMMD1082]|uniref:hypothetical protein n=1 Tax=Micromonospora sp. WMMD1082 TaxID=3016104 RepID=UPI00241612DC|nr:hypothetical protein [Micromonospora sp. WMMD1082]MDG4797197.1 hypothetical protein [Micromonospora sp. WMMD1082]
MWLLRDGPRSEGRPVWLVFTSVAAQVSVQGRQEERCVEAVALGECLPVIRVLQEPDEPLRAISLTGVVSTGVVLLYWGCREGAGVEVCTPLPQGPEDVVCVTTSSLEDVTGKATCAEFSKPVPGAADRTEVVTFAPVDADGAAADGYRVTDAGERYKLDDCSPAYAATAPDIVSCFPFALGAHACWVEASRETVLCGMPGSNELRRHAVRKKPGRIEPPAEDQRQPLVIELRDGTRCTMRWGGPHPPLPDQLTARYHCGDHGILVQRLEAPLWVEADPFWTVEILRLADVQQGDAAPLRHEVAFLHYAGRP